MNKIDRFTEIVSTIELLPEDIDECNEENLLIPNNSDGLDEGMAKALICQAIKSDVDFRNKFYLALMNSTMKAVMARGEILEQDLVAFAVCANVAWYDGQGEGIFKAISALTHSVECSGLECPELIFTIFKPPAVAKGLENKNPYDYLG